MREEVELSVVLVDGEGAGIGVAVGGQGHVFVDVRHTLEGAVRIEAQRKVIEGVRVTAGLRPDAEAEATDDRWPGRIENFRVVRVPLGKTLIDDGTIGNGWIGCALGREDDVPETDDGDAGPFVVVLRTELRSLSGGTKRYGPG